MEKIGREGRMVEMVDSDVALTKANNHHDSNINDTDFFLSELIALCNKCPITPENA